MGHLGGGKDIYENVRIKMDRLDVKVPGSKVLYEALKEIFTPLEAEIYCSMPYTVSTAKKISRITNIQEAELEKVLSGMASKGLVIDMYLKDRYYYMPSPMVIGVFEFTMMRTGDDINPAHLAGLFHHYLQEGEFYRANMGKGEKISPLRAVPYEAALEESHYTEVLDYEKAQEIIENSKKYALGFCSCRREKHYTGEKNCDIKLESCSTFDVAAEYLIRNGLSKEITRKEALENLEYVKENRLVILADNVKNNVLNMCYCCGCCCNVLLGISCFGHPNMVTTSTFIARIDHEKCNSCGKCVKACPVDAIEMSEKDGKKTPQLNTRFCMGCGVCALSCKPQALRLVKRGQRVLHPENSFERTLLQRLERGNLHHMLFDDPQKITLKFMKGFVGGFLRLSPVKKALVSDTFRSRFLSTMKAGARKQGQGFLTGD